MEQEQSSPWRWDDNRPPQSQWLRSTLSDMDSKIKMILDLIEDDGDTFAKRAEMYYQKRPELIKMVQELHKSYRALADKYDHQQLKSESFSVKAISNNNEYYSVSNFFGKVEKSSGKEANPQLNLPCDHQEYLASCSESESSSSSFELNFVSIDSCCDNESMNIKEESDPVLRGSKMLDEQMKFSKFLEENLSQQAELIRRNEEKRETIIELRNENKFLRKCSSTNTTGHNKGTRNKDIRIKEDKKDHKKDHKGKFMRFFCMPLISVAI